MCEPGELSKYMGKPADRAVLELIHATQAMDMEPSPQPLPDDYDGPAFLSYTDKWIEHARDHVTYAIRILAGEV